MTDTAYESVFQADIVNQMQANGWQLGHASGYTAETALYEQDVLEFVQTTQRRSGKSFVVSFLSTLSAKPL